MRDVPESAAEMQQVMHADESYDCDEPSVREPTKSNLMIAGLAALVIRLARMSLFEGKMVSGTSRTHGSPVGLGPDDRRAMSVISRACLIQGLPDYGAEIHDLLALCTRPLGEWLSIPEVARAGLSHTVLIHADDGIPTAEAEELAAGFTGMTAAIEEQLFARFMDALSRHPEQQANGYYTRVREFIIRHPVCNLDEFKLGLTDEVPARVWMIIQREFYEAVPMGWCIDGTLPICDHCGNAMKKGRAGLVCRTAACVAIHPARSSTSVTASSVMRVARGIRQYWVEPGIDELRLYDALRASGTPAELYPFRDRVDIAVGDTGIDLKTYVSPETLGQKFKRSIGGLAYYPDRLLVIPDWHAASVPSYLDRLTRTMGRDDVTCLTVSEALARLSSKESGYA
ncbi:hypothetical protein [Burkholderia ubonensis]|uniref:restriction endonuclease-related protein n=1 Tax=Burkholderia ubonensis TaxID=101571 RepID=UPI0012F72D1E|nr:hypothetical protein [Burkholderia ubonensis]